MKKVGNGSNVMDIDISLGYVMIPRSLLNSSFFVCEKTLKVWLYCYLKANHKDKWLKVKIGKGYKEVHIKRGQFLYGRHIAEKECNLNGVTIDNHIQKICKYGDIIRDSFNHYSIITICEYDYYQTAQNYSLQQTVNNAASNQQDNSNKVASNEQQTCTNNNDNNEKNDNYKSNNYGNKKSNNSNPKSQKKEKRTFSEGFI